MRRLTSLGSAILFAFLLLAGCGADGKPTVYQSGAMRVTSPAFAPGGSIPKKHALEPEGQNVSPPIEWSGAPDAAQKFALFVDDPDAPGQATFAHWVVWNIPGTAKSLPEGVPPTAPDLVQGANGYGKLGWGGPKPPPGETHKYVFTVYALDGPLSLPSGSTADKVVDAMRGHVLGNGRLIVHYP